MIIYTKRLELVTLTPVFLRAMLEERIDEAAQISGFSVPVDLLAAKDVLEMRLAQLESDPTLQPWLLRAMVLREARAMIGHIGFHTAPGPEYLRSFAPGAVEFGFEVYAPHLRQGYAREAAEALMSWAKEHHGVKKFVLSIRPDNAASQALAASLGFVKIGSHIDAVDGFEDILLSGEMAP
jgi:ribosomal-protein-alanine N-acetyltransferase